MQKARDCFSLMLFLQGMPYVDLTHLRKCDLSGNLLTCRDVRRVRNFVFVSLPKLWL